jgi:hypothetical protein
MYTGTDYSPVYPSDAARLKQVLLENFSFYQNFSPIIIEALLLYKFSFSGQDSRMSRTAASYFVV